jgi:hypothetical protein
MMLLIAASLLVSARSMTGPSAIARPSTSRAWLRPNWSLVALGALLVMSAAVKASSALAALFVCVVCLVVVGGRRLGSAVLALAAGAAIGMLLHWGLIAEPPWRDLRRLWRGAEVLRRLDSHDADAVWQIDFVRSTVVPWAVGLTVVGGLIWLAWKWVVSIVVRTVAMGGLAIVAAGLLWSDRPRGGPLAVSDATGWWWIRMGAVALVATTALAPRASRLLAVGPAVAALALAASIGSNAGLVRQTGVFAGLTAVGVLAQAAVATDHRRGWWEGFGPLVPVSVYFLVASLASFGMVDGALATPYRLAGSLEESTRRVELGSFGSVWVTPATETYIATLQALSAELSDAQRACLVDLSGGTPLAAIALGARPAGAAWLIGGYDGSAAAAEYWLSLEDCTTGPIALLEAPGGRRAIPRPAWLAGRELRVVGEVPFDGYQTERQVLSVAGPGDAG